MSHSSVVSHASLRIASLISILLLMTGIENKPGPKTDDPVLQLNVILTELKNTRAALTTKLDDSVKRLSRLNSTVST